MRKGKFLFLVFIIFCIQQANAQLLHNKTGYFIDYGVNNNTGIGIWNKSISNSFFSDSLRTYESHSGLIFKGVSNNPPIKGHDHISFGQNRIWGTDWYPYGFNVDMSKPENMGVKIRIRSTGTVYPTIYMQLNDTLARFNYDGKTFFSSKLTNEYQEFYYSFENFWKSIPNGINSPIVDSSAISGFGFTAEFDSPVFDLSQVGIEIDYIQIGSYVDWPSNSITGRVYNDNNGDCKFNSNDIPVKQALVKAEPGPYYAYTDENGFYELKVDTIITSFNVTYIPREAQANYLEKICPASSSYIVATPKGKSTYCCNDFAQKVKLCTDLKIDISSNRRRRCFTNQTYVNYSNAGTLNSAAAEIRVVYPDYVEPLSSIPAWTRKNGNTLYYAIKTIEANSNSTISITDSVVCGIEEIRFLTQCTEASLSITNTCIEEHVDWDKADVIVRGKCDKGIAKIKILNEGRGDMMDSTRYRVYANDTLISINKFALKSQEYFDVELPAYGKAIRLEADQVANHPDYNTIPRVCFEGCVANTSLLKTASKGYGMSVPQNNDALKSTSCMQIIDSYDPNDKAVFPKGKSLKNYILAGTKLDYTIRFENTGTDDAYTVVVVDTLDTDLDAATFVAGNSSHPYSIKRVLVDQREIIEFHFNKINLTPKKIDSIKSQGFIKFSISTKTDLSDETVIDNEANIFFDYNSAIITNIVSHTIGEYFEEDFTKGNIISRTMVTAIPTAVSSPTLQTFISVFPNPTNENINIKFPSGSGNARLTIYSINGTSLLTKDIDTANETTISLHEFYQGIYYYKITDQHGLNQNGKIIKQ